MMEGHLRNDSGGVPSRRPGSSGVQYEDEELAREGEVYIYLAVLGIAPQEPQSSSYRPTANPNLLALAQLAAIRTNTKRCLIALTDSKVQYIVAEAGPESSLDAADSEPPWLGCNLTERSGSVCEYILFTDVASLTRNCFTVSNLSADERFRDLTYVKGEPHARFYAAVPLFSAFNYCIGSIIVVDVEPRDGLSETQEKALEHMAVLVSDHLENIKGKEHHYRSVRMIRGLGYFSSEGLSASASANSPRELQPTVVKLQSSKLSITVEEDFTPEQSSPTLDKASDEPEYRFRVPDSSSAEATPLEVDKQLHTVVDAKTEAIISSEPRFQQQRPANTDHDGLSSSVPQFKQIVAADGINLLFQRASVIIKDCLAVDSVRFYDASVSSFGGYIESSQKATGKSGTRSRRGRLSSNAFGIRLRPVSPFTGDVTGEDKRRSTGVFTSIDQGVQSTILGDSSGNFGQNRGMKEGFMQRLIQSYPNGRAFRLNPHTSDTSKDSSQKAYVRGKPAAGQETVDTAILSEIFPEAKCLVFCPLWDFHRERWFAAGFAYSKDELRCFTAREDLDYFSSFGTILMSEVARTDALNADKAKLSFISSVSHELRSPLHGIMTSAELMRESVVDSFQHSMLDSIERSGNLLLNCVNYILDYTQINSVLNPDGQIKGSGEVQLQVFNSLDPTQDQTDLCDLLEECLESCTVGKFSRHNTDGVYTHLEKRGSEGLEEPVIFILDIDWQSDWTFSTKPGAWFRIISNVFGNALKYTSSGFIKVSLKAENTTTSLSNVILTVSDSGQGISQEFLQSKIFRPFSQEDGLSPGTGLGLNIVSRLVEMMGGTIDIKSEKSFGTDFNIGVNLQRENQVASPRMFLPLEIRERTRKMTVCVVNSSRSDGSSVKNAIRERCLASLQEVIEKMATTWFGFETRRSDSLDEATGDIIVIHDSDPSIAARNLETVSVTAENELEPENQKRAPLIVVSSSRLEGRGPRNSITAYLTNQTTRFVKVVTLPLGPYKFARVLNECLDYCDRDIVGLPEPIVLPQTRDDSSAGTHVAALPQKSGSSSQSEATGAVIDYSGDIMRPTLRAPSTPTSIDGVRLRTDRPRLLLVDDNDINLKRIAERSLYPYRTAENGLQALKVYESENGGFDMVFMDLSMPVMNGIEATKKIRRYEAANALANSYIVALTALASAAAKTDAFGVGIDVYITKPASTQKIASIIEDWKNSDYTITPQQSPSLPVLG